MTRTPSINVIVVMHKTIDEDFKEKTLRHNGKSEGIIGNLKKLE